MSWAHLPQQRQGPRQAQLDQDRRQPIVVDKHPRTRHSPQTTWSADDKGNRWTRGWIIEEQKSVLASFPGLYSASSHLAPDSSSPSC
jgi:hypothetical protein